MAIPQWFWDAVEAPRQDNAVEVDEADVTYTRWTGPAGAPGLLLVHGMNAHRRWWDFIAPQLTDQYDVEVDEADVTYTRWTGPAGAPGLLLVHGMNAHRRWWDFIAPQLTDQYEVAALDLAGMGDADDRYDYSAELWAESLVAVADAAGL